MFKLSPRILFVCVALVILTNQSAVNGATLKCDYNQSTTMAKGVDVYYCDVFNNGIFTGERVSIDSAEGTHKAGYTNAKVNGLLLIIPSLKLFPRNLENIFGDLIAIEAFNSNLQEIKQADIKVFPKLQSLNLGANEITKLDADLFKFNPELRQIYLFQNKISHIDATTFDHLNHLIYLSLELNECENILGYARNSRSDVLDIIKKVNDGECLDNDHLKIMEKTEESAIELKNLAVKGIKIISGGSCLNVYFGKIIIFFAAQCAITNFLI